MKKLVLSLAAMTLAAPAYAGVFLPHTGQTTDSSYNLTSASWGFGDDAVVVGCASWKISGAGACSIYIYTGHNPSSSGLGFYLSIPPQVEPGNTVQHKCFAEQVGTASAYIRGYSFGYWLNLDANFIGDYTWNDRAGNLVIEFDGYANGIQPYTAYTLTIHCAYSNNAGGD